MAGTVYTVPPIPPDPEDTTWVDAGAIRVGVEYRLLDGADLAANYEGEAMEEILAAVDAKEQATVEDNGVSLHVVGTGDGHEYLRFDMFETGPHYHYIDRSGEKQRIVDYDPVALGPMLVWVLDRLRGNIDAMLAEAGGEALLAELDRERIDAALVEVERLAVEAEAVLRGRRSAAPDDRGEED